MVPSATPDQLLRDGTSQSVVRVIVYDDHGKPKSGQQINIALSSRPSGTSASASAVTTLADGSATFSVTAPPPTATGDFIVVSLIPVGTNADQTTTHTLSIRVTPSNPNPPVAAFTFLPATPLVNDVVTFDASISTDEGVSCATTCSFAWDFGDGSTGTGRTLSHAFTSPGNKLVTLTVTDPAGASSTTTRTVPVVSPAPPVAVITVSPSGDQPAGTTLNFDASGSTVGAGATIVDYTWVWGDGSANTVSTTPQATHQFLAPNTYTVRLTIRDSLGRTSTVTASVTII
jgi:PKD repeat protein